MKKFLICLCLYGGGTFLSASSRLWFLNGDSLEAKFVDQQEDVTRLRFPWHSDLVSVPSRLIDKINLGFSAQSDLSPHWATLSNGDVLKGTLLSLDATTARMKTSWGTILHIDRDQLQGLKFFRTGGVVFQEYGRIQNWKVEREKDLNQFQQQGEVSEDAVGLLFRGKVRVSKRMLLPKQGFTIDLGMAFNGTHPNFMISMKGVLDDNGKQTDVQLYFSRSTIFGRSSNKSHTAIDWRLRISDAPKLLQNSPRILLTADPLNTKFTLWMNQVKLHEWSYKGKELSSQKEFTLELANGNPTSSCWLTDISIIRGVDLPLEEEPASGKFDAVLLGNRDRLSGKVEGIQDDTMLLAVSGREGLLPVALRVINRIDFQSGDRKTPKRRNGDVRLTFRDGSIMTVELLHVGQKELRLRSAGTLNEIIVPSEKIHVIDFNPYFPNSPLPEDEWMLEQLDALE